MEDNYSMWERHERKQEKWLGSRPLCSCCNEPIQEDYYYEINEEKICAECLRINFMRII